MFFHFDKFIVVFSPLELIFSDKVIMLAIFLIELLSPGRRRPDKIEEIMIVLDQPVDQGLLSNSKWSADDEELVLHRSGIERMEVLLGKQVDIIWLGQEN